MSEEDADLVGELTGFCHVMQGAKIMKGVPCRVPDRAISTQIVWKLDLGLSLVDTAFIKDKIMFQQIRLQETY